MEETKRPNRQSSPSHLGARNPGAADLCREFMQSFGWAELFAFAKGEERVQWVRTPFGSKRCRVNPSIEERLTALKFISAYGYGRPREQLDVTSGGRSVTDFILGAVGRRPGGGVPEEGV